MGTHAHCAGVPLRWGTPASGANCNAKRTCDAQNPHVDRRIEDWVRSLGLDAYLVGGAVRDELLGKESKDADFLVPGVDTDGLKRALASHGRVEDLVVADRLVDPFGGEQDLRHGILRTVSPRSFQEDPLRLVRGLRFISQLGLDPDGRTLEQMRAEAPAVRLVSGERIGGGIAADGMGELSKLLLGAQPAKALRLARDTGVLVEVLPEFEAAIGFEQPSERQVLPLDEHLFTVAQAAADAGDSLAVRLAALLHDLGK